MSKKRTTREQAPSDEDLRKMAEHIVYEIEAFQEGFKCWREMAQKEKSGISVDLRERNRIAEHALLHFRVLREFFAKREKTQPRL